MIGIVTNEGEALMSMEVWSTPAENGSPAPIQIEAVIDTGFSGELTLPPQTIQQLSLGSRGEREVMLADGSESVLSLYGAWGLWHGRSRFLEVLEADGGPLVGMGLLWGQRATYSSAARRRRNHRGVLNFHDRRR